MSDPLITLSTALAVNVTRSLLVGNGGKAMTVIKVTARIYMICAARLLATTAAQQAVICRGAERRWPLFKLFAAKTR
jgi:hypothetical protein